MALKDFFKRKKPPVVKPLKDEKEEIKKEKVGLKKPEELEQKREGESKRKQEVREAPAVLYSPHIAEKPTQLAEMNQYVFRVFQGANKKEVKKAVEEIYNVDVLKVRMIKLPGKKRRVGGKEGWKTGLQKAIVKVKEGQKIEILPR